MAIFTPLLASGAVGDDRFQLVLFREAVEGVVPGPFTSTDTGAAFKQRRKRRWLLGR